MKTVAGIDEVRQEVAKARGAGAIIGLVPTMGALHDGHIALLRTAREQCGFVVVSVFVNPTQFGANEDLAKYPRTLPEDLLKCESAGVDVVFAPTAADMYPAGFSTWVDVESVSKRYEGAARPHHFRGVATVCTKLFNVIGPNRAYFGQKDYQQLQVLRRLARDLNMGLEIVAVETVREPDGLAMSSRNAYLSAEERRAAIVLNQALRQARQAWDSGEREASEIERLVNGQIKQQPLAQIDYVAVADADTLEPLDRIDTRAVVLVAVRFPSARLIDNILLG